MDVEMYVTLPLKITNFVQLCRGNVILTYVELQNNFLKVEISEDGPNKVSLLSKCFDWACVILFGYFICAYQYMMLIWLKMFECPIIVWA